MRENKYNMRNLKAVVFDMDGVVIDSKPVIEEFWQSLAEKYGFVISEEVMDAHVHGCPVWITCDKVFPMMSARDIDELIVHIHEIEQQLEFQKLAGLDNFLNSLSLHNIPIALVTSSYEKKVEKIFREMSLTAYFHHVVTADSVENGKPHPEPYLKASHQLGILPEKCLVFEDSISGIISAKEAGMNCIGINKPKMELKLKSIGASEVIEDFRSVVFQNEASFKGISISNNKYLNFD